MILHQGISIKTGRESGFVFRKVGEISLKIGFVQKDSLFLITPGYHMVEGAGKMNTGFSSHEAFIALPKFPVNTLLSLPDPRFSADSDPRFCLKLGRRSQGNREAGRAGFIASFR